MLSANKLEMDGTTPDKSYKNEPLEDPEEQAHFRHVASAFFFYQYETMRDIARMERDFSAMNPKQTAMLNFNYKKDRI